MNIKFGIETDDNLICAMILLCNLLLDMHENNIKWIAIIRLEFLSPLLERNFSVREGPLNNETREARSLKEICHISQSKS